MTRAYRGTIVFALALAGVVHGGTLSAQVYSPGHGVTPPRVVRSTPMPRPASMVILECVVQSDGTLSDTKVVRSGGTAADDAVRSAVAQWQFESGAKDGTPVAVRFHISFTPTR